MDWDFFLQKIVPAITAVVSIIVLFKQFQIQKNQQELSKIKHLLETEEHRLKLYDRRYEVFRTVETFLGSAAYEGKVTNDNYDAFITTAYDNRMLFPEEIGAYLKEMRTKARMSLIWGAFYWHKDGNKLSEDQQNEFEELVEWFEDKRLNLDKTFGPYIRVEQSFQNDKYS